MGGRADKAAIATGNTGWRAAASRPPRRRPHARPAPPRAPATSP